MAIRSRRGLVRSSSSYLLVLGAALAAAGCGKPVADLEGKVTYKNKPLPFGWVKLLASDGIFRDAKIEPGGMFRFTRVPAGDAKLTVSCIDPKIDDYMKGVLAKRGGSPQKAGKAEEDPFAKFYLIPREYEDVTKSKLPFH